MIRPDKGTGRKIRVYLSLACAAILAVAALIAIQVMFEFKEQKKTGGMNVPNIMSALQALAHEQMNSNHQMPGEVPLSTLIERGYLTADDVRPFKGMDLRFPTQIDTSTKPGAILAYVRTPDDYFICALMDGSIQQLTRSGYEEYMKNTYFNR